MFGAGYAGAARPALPDGRPAPHRPRRTRLLPRRLQRRRRRRRSGASRPTPKPTSKSSWRRRRRLYGAGRPAGGRRRRQTTSPASTPTSPPPNVEPDAEAGRVRAARTSTIEPFKPTDVIAIASLIGGIFGRGGGNELNSALTMQAFVDRMGDKAGPQRLGSASAPRTTRKRRPRSPRRFPYETASAFAKRGLALPDRGSVRPTEHRFGLEPEGVPELDERRRAPPAGDRGGRACSSTCYLVLAKESTNGHPIAVMGPQVGYYILQILDGGGPARSPHRRPRGLLRRRQPGRRGARPRLRLERHHGDLRQR